MAKKKAEKVAEAVKVPKVTQVEVPETKKSVVGGRLGPVEPAGEIFPGKVE